MSLVEGIFVALSAYIVWSVLGFCVMMGRRQIHHPYEERELGPVGKVLAAAFLATNVALDWLAENYGWLIYQKPENERGDAQ